MRRNRLLPAGARGVADVIRRSSRIQQRGAMFQIQNVSPNTVNIVRGQDLVAVMTTTESVRAREEIKVEISNPHGDLTNFLQDQDLVRFVCQRLELIAANRHFRNARDRIWKYQITANVTSNDVNDREQFRTYAGDTVDGNIAQKLETTFRETMQQSLETYNWMETIESFLVEFSQIRFDRNAQLGYRKSPGEPNPMLKEGPHLGDGECLYNCLAEATKSATGLAYHDLLESMREIPQTYASLPRFEDHLERSITVLGVGNTVIYPGNPQFVTVAKPMIYLYCENNHITIMNPRSAAYQLRQMHWLRAFHKICQEYLGPYEEFIEKIQHLYPNTNVFIVDAIMRQFNFVLEVNGDTLSHVKHRPFDFSQDNIDENATYYNSTVREEAEESEERRTLEKKKTALQVLKLLRNVEVPILHRYVKKPQKNANMVFNARELTSLDNVIFADFETISIEKSTSDHTQKLQMEVIDIAMWEMTKGGFPVQFVYNKDEPVPIMKQFLDELLDRRIVQLNQEDRIGRALDMLKLPFKKNQRFMHVGEIERAAGRHKGFQRKTLIEFDYYLSLSIPTRVQRKRGKEFQNRSTKIAIESDSRIHHDSTSKFYKHQTHLNDQVKQKYAQQKNIQLFIIDPSKFSDEQLLRHLHTLLAPVHLQAENLEYLEAEQANLRDMPERKRPKHELTEINEAVRLLEQQIYETSKLSWLIVNNMVKHATKSAVECVKTLSRTEITYVNLDGVTISHKFGHEWFDIVDFYQTLQGTRDDIDFGVNVQNLTVLFHNGSKFDLMFIMQFLAQPEYRSVYQITDICQSNGALLTMTLNNNIRFVDSYRLTSMTLDDLAATYVKPSDHDDIIKYSGGSVRIVDKIIRKDLFPYEILMGQNREEILDRLNNLMTVEDYLGYFKDHSVNIDKKKIQCFLKGQSINDRSKQLSEVTALCDALDLHLDKKFVPMTNLTRYCVNDVVLLGIAFKRFRESLWTATSETGKGIDCLTKLTLPAMAFQNWLDSLEESLPQAENPSLYATSDKGFVYFTGLPKLLDEKQFEFIKSSTLGGICCNYTTMELDCSESKTEKIYTTDVVSEYPASVIKSKLLGKQFTGFPIPENEGKYHEISFNPPVKVNMKFWRKYPHGFMEISYQDNREPYYDGNKSAGGLSLCQRHERTGRLTHFMSGRTILPSNQVRYAVNQGVDVICHKMLYSKTCVQPFNKFITTWVDRKNKWDKVIADQDGRQDISRQGDSKSEESAALIREANVQREICKLFLNSLIGKMGQRLQKSEIRTVATENDLYALATSGIFAIHDFDCKMDAWGEGYHLLKIEDRNFESQTMSSKNLQYLASFAMGYSKLIILDGLREVIELGGKPLYIDTDSITYAGTEAMKDQFIKVKGRSKGLKIKELGTFEDDNGKDFHGKKIAHFDKFISMGPKKKVLETATTVKCRFGGLQMNLNQDICMPSKIRRELYRQEGDTEDMWYAKSFQIGEQHSQRFAMQMTNSHKRMAYDRKQAKMKNDLLPSGAHIYLEIYQSPDEYDEVLFGDQDGQLGRNE